MKNIWNQSKFDGEGKVVVQTSDFSFIIQVISQSKQGRFLSNPLTPAICKCYLVKEKHVNAKCRSMQGALESDSDQVVFEIAQVRIVIRSRSVNAIWKV